MASFSGPRKAVQRSVVLEFARQHHPYKSAVMLPAEGGYDVQSGIIETIFSKDTSFIFAEKNRKVLASIDKFIESLGIGAQVHAGDIATMPLSDMVKAPVDFLYYDLCGHASDRAIAGQALQFLASPPGTFDQSIFMAFTYCLNTRVFDLPYVDRIAAKSEAELPRFEIFGASDSVELMKWGKVARTLYRAQLAVIPGNVQDSKAFVYLSEDVPMVTLMFRVYHDRVVAHEKLFYLTDVLGLDLKNPAPLPMTGKSQSIKPTPTKMKSVKPAAPRFGRSDPIVTKIDATLLRELVGKQDLSLAKFSLSCGFSHSALSNILKTGSASKSFATILAAKLGVPADQLILSERRRTTTPREL